MIEVELSILPEGGKDGAPGMLVQFPHGWIVFTDPANAHQLAHAIEETAGEFDTAMSTWTAEQDRTTT